MILLQTDDAHKRVYKAVGLWQTALAIEGRVTGASMPDRSRAL